MAARVVTCLVITCDDCGEGQDGDWGTPHFESLQAAQHQLAEDDLTGWVITDRGDARCPECRQRSLCSSVGHDWVTHQAYGGGRFCDRCGAYAPPRPGPGQLELLEAPGTEMSR